MINQNFFEEYKENLSSTLNKIKNRDLNLIIKILVAKLKSNKKIFICGNGGSAANANHIEIDLLNNNLPLNITSLNSNIPVITCIANDFGYENIFSKQIEIKAKRGDLLILLSGSGNSKNILKAIKTAKKIGINTFGLFGYSGGRAIKLAEKSIHIDSNNMQICEDVQMIIFHYITQILKKKSYGKN